MAVFFHRVSSSWVFLIVRAYYGLAVFGTPPKSETFTPNITQTIYEPKKLKLKTASQKTAKIWGLY